MSRTNYKLTLQKEFLEKSEERDRSLSASSSPAALLPRATIGGPTASGGLGVARGRSSSTRKRPSTNLMLDQSSAPFTFSLNSPSRPMDLGMSNHLSRSVQSDMGPYDYNPDLVSPGMEELKFGDFQRMFDALPSEAKAMRSDHNTPGSSLTSSRASSIAGTPRSTPISPYFESAGLGDSVDKLRKRQHNDVEKKRRYNINDRIGELKTLLPKTSEFDCRDSKGAILQKTCDYVRKMQNRVQVIDPLEVRIRDLEQLVKSQFLGMQRLCTILTENQLPVPSDIPSLQSDAMEQIMGGAGGAALAGAGTSPSRAGKIAASSLPSSGLQPQPPPPSSVNLLGFLDQPHVPQEPQQQQQYLYQTEQEVEPEEVEQVASSNRLRMLADNTFGASGTDEQVDTLTGMDMGSLGFPGHQGENVDNGDCSEEQKTFTSLSEWAQGF